MRSLHLGDGRFPLTRSGSVCLSPLIVRCYWPISC
jgi:hypothetical protein